MPAWAVALICLAPVALCVGLVAVAARRRRSIAEWILWRAGNMRFTSLEQTDHRRALELELEEMERSRDADGVDFAATDSPGGATQLASASVTETRCSSVVADVAD